LERSPGNRLSLWPCADWTDARPVMSDDPDADQHRSHR
jgi:hypothetical protein